MSDFWWKRLSQKAQAKGRMSAWIMRCVASVDERRNDLLQRRHLWGRSAALSEFEDDDICKLDDEEIGLHPATETAILRLDNIGVNDAQNDGAETNDEYSADDKDEDSSNGGGKEEQEAEDVDTATTSSYGFQMREFLRRTTALSTCRPLSRCSPHRPLLSIIAANDVCTIHISESNMYNLLIKIMQEKYTYQPKRIREINRHTCFSAVARI